MAGPIFVPPSGIPHPLTREEMPVVFGHELGGRVVEVGERVSNVAFYTIRARSESASTKPSAPFASTSTRRNTVPPEPEATSILSVASPTRR